MTYKAHPETRQLMIPVGSTARKSKPPDFTSNYVLSLIYWMA